ncbi:MAG: DUF4157 domain-containing protein, partial [Nostocales cyanobacterium]
QRQEAPEEEEELQMKPLEISTLQRQEAPEEEEELQMKPMVQRQANGGMAATADLETSINQARGGGQPLGDNIRKPMEQAFGADFGGVKVHTDSHSDHLNRSIQARAFTTAQDIFFRQGEYNPGSPGGQELLAHELTHVVQQNGGMVQREVYNGLETQRRILQRKVAAWANVQVASGTEVYHCTNYASAKNIIENGIQDVANGWGGGSLGAGFYTHTTINGAVNYAQKKVVLKFTVSRNAVGQSVTPSDYASKNKVQANEDPVALNDFLSNAEDANEIKWHGGDALTFNGFALGPAFDNFYANEQAMENELYVSLSEMALHQ